MSAPFEHSPSDDTKGVDDTSSAFAQSSRTAEVAVATLFAPATGADREVLLTLRGAGALVELDPPTLEHLLERATRKDDHARQLDLLELYYLGDEDPATIARRIRADRFVIHHGASAENAHAVVRRMAAVAPELSQLRLERIGSEDGPLVLRAGEHICAVTEDEDEPDSGEIDLSDLDDGFIAVRSLMRAGNLLLQRHGVEVRWVLLRCDGQREAYCALSADPALDLCARGLLDDRRASRLLDFCAW